METKTLGRTGLEVTRLGVGLSEIGESNIKEAGQVLNYALDNGLNFLDTSACYGHSEDLIGKSVSHRRSEFILATKCGHVAGDYKGQDWTVETLTHSIDRSLRRLKTDYVDILQFHSADIEEMAPDEIMQTLLNARQAGKTRFIGYSGDNTAAQWAVNSGIFDTLQTSFNLVDQQARTHLFEQAKAQNMGIIIKRPIANGAWGVDKSPSAYADQYFARAQKMIAQGAIPQAPSDRILLALGFVMAHPQVDTAIVGTANPKHLLANIQLVEEDLPIASEAVLALQARFDQLGKDWPQLR